MDHQQYIQQPTQAELCHDDQESNIKTYNNTWAIEMHFINFFELNFGEISYGGHFMF